jgi:hypothetical protein
LLCVAQLHLTMLSNSRPVSNAPPAMPTCCVFASPSYPRRYAGTWDAIRRIWAEEGPGGYFKGMQAKILQTALNAALMLMIKEQVGLRLGGWGCVWGC